MPTHQGSCHCGQVKFEVDAEITALNECNRSLCRRKGALYVSALQFDQVRIVAGEAELAVYQFGTGAATHLFCRHCGIHPFHHPRLKPNGWSVNARCLDDFDQLRTLPIRQFDSLTRVRPRIDPSRGPNQDE